MAPTRHGRNLVLGCLMLAASLALIPFPAHADRGWLAKYEDGSRSFSEVEIGDRWVVYYHRRTIGEATVEKDFVVYRFDKHTGELLAKESHWRDDLPPALPSPLIPREEAMAKVVGEAQSARLWIISPDSDVFPLKPPPTDPCWVINSLKDGWMIVTIVDAVDGRVLGNGIPPPYRAFALSGPVGFQPCGGSWSEWTENAGEWFSSMGYLPEQVMWPTQEQIRNHVQSTTTSLFYELAHGASFYFVSGCENDNSVTTPAGAIEMWIADYPKMPFAFIGSCDGMCDTTGGSLSHAFRKGSFENTATVGLCHMASDSCVDCWSVSLDWQDTFFRYASTGMAVKDALDWTMAHYPICADNECVRFAGDPDFALVPPVPRTGRVYFVDPEGTGNYPTIQAAVDAASEGDFVELEDGTFTGPGNRDVVVAGKAILIRSRSGNPDECVVDCGGQGRGFFFHSGGRLAPALVGIGIVNGRASGPAPGDRGGAIYCRGSSLIMERCRILASQADGPGGGLCCDSSAVSLTDCVLGGNTCGASGGGIAADSSSLDLVDCRVFDNSSGELGGGLWMSGACGAALTACEICGNTAGTGGGGMDWACSGALKDCTVHGNRSAGPGGGIRFAVGTDSGPSFDHCTVSGNYAASTGGGMDLEESSDLRVDYAIVWGNEAGGEGEEIYLGAGATDARFQFCDVDSSGVRGEGTAVWLWHNLFVPPGFCRPEEATSAPTGSGDYHVKDVSPCVEPACPYGQIGALGAGCSPNVYAVRPDGSGDYATIQDAVDAILDYDVIELSSGTYTGPGNREIDFLGKVLTIRPRSGRADSCVIDCEGQGRAFLFHSGEGRAAAIENLTLRNGHAATGGAVYCDRSSPRLAGCVFCDNAADEEGGAVFLAGASPLIERCTLAGNAAPSGAGIHCTSSSPTVTHTILALGLSGESVSGDGDSHPVLSCCDVYGNEGGDWVGCIAAWEGVDGNFCADPLFYDAPGGDFHIHLTSPCTDAPGCGQVGALGKRLSGRRDWLVPADAPTIHAALDSAAAGDTVVIACGVYHESGILLKPHVWLRSEAREADCVVIDAGGQGRVLTCMDLDSTSVIEGITLTGGDARGTWPENGGGAVYCQNASPVFEGCCFVANSADYGGAVAAKSATPAFRRCTFSENAGSASGGGIYSYFGSSLFLERCIIARSSQGVAIQCHYQASATLSCSDVYGNAGGDWVGCIATQRDVDGNLCSDPLFCDPASMDYHLTAASPCAPGNAPAGCEQVGALGVSCSITEVAETRADVPTVLWLGPAVPNPFKPVTEIAYGIPAGRTGSRVTLSIYDALGRRVETLVDGDPGPGTHRVTWDGRDRKGSHVASGVYFYRICWNGESRTRRMVLLK